MPRKVRERVEPVRAAREAGFDLIGTGRHYLAAPYQMSSSLPLLGRLAAEAGDMAVAAIVILVPVHNPVEPARDRFLLGSTGGVVQEMGVPRRGWTPTN
jgi:alkanesulfonate monooxygenase SsuD/methylene tetrahydromethanopterin reductase-like flavin-dependent oxidoreductase (luciferase family)